jgi:hypothetical protein
MTSFGNSDCPICLNRIPANGSVTTKCKHSYCIDCFIKHIESNNSCPLCRLELCPKRVSPVVTGTIWQQFIRNLRMARSMPSQSETAAGTCFRTLELISNSTSFEEFERNARNNYELHQRHMEQRRQAAAMRLETYQARTSREKRDARLRRQMVDRERGLVVGAKIILNPLGIITGRRMLGLNSRGEEDGSEATITKVMSVNLECTYDYRGHESRIRFRKDLPYYNVLH